MDHAQRVVNRYEIERTEFFPDCVEHRRFVSDRSSGVRRQIKIERWRRKKSLGRGSYGDVWLEEEEEEEGKLRAVKIIRKDENASTNTRRLQELFAMAYMSKNLVCFLDFEGWFQDKDHLFIAMEYCELGDLQKYIKGTTDGYLPEEEVRTIIFQLTECLDYMHKEDIVHRDLKPNNVLVVYGTPRWWIKLTDFGVSKWVHENTTLYTAYCGDYMAPEVSMSGSPNSSTYSNAVDMWSLGCMAHWLSTGQTPFKGLLDLYDYCNNRKSFPLKALQEHGLSAACITFISTLMAKEPAERMSASQALESSWLHSERLDASPLGTVLQPTLPSNVNDHDYHDLVLEKIDGSKSPSTVDAQTTHADQVTVPNNNEILSGELSEPEDTANSRSDISPSQPEGPEGAGSELVRFPQVPDVHLPTPLLPPVDEVRELSLSKVSLPDIGEPKSRNINRIIDFIRDNLILSGAYRVCRPLIRWRPAESAKPIQSPLDTKTKDQSAACSWNQSQIDQHIPGSWDQFEANKRLFGIIDSFDDQTFEETYTTVLDRTSPTYKSREAEAEVIEHEILSGVQQYIGEATEQSVYGDFRPSNTGNDSLVEPKPSVQEHNKSSASIDSLPDRVEQPQLSKGQKKKKRAKTRKMENTP